jgi:putative intracellular protease/amidase
MVFDYTKNRAKEIGNRNSAPDPESVTMKSNFNVLLFDGFETLDACGPIEVMGRLQKQYRIRAISPNGGAVLSAQSIEILTQPLLPASNGVFGADANPQYPDARMNHNVLLVPGGIATRDLVTDTGFLDALRDAAERSEWVLAVCTGSALLAAAGLLDGLEATSNKRAFKWVSGVNTRVRWLPRARWAVVGKYYTSSGISAGIDMTLGFVADRHGTEVAKEAAADMEYRWEPDKGNDPFALA